MSLGHGSLSSCVHASRLHARSSSLLLSCRLASRTATIYSSETLPLLALPPLVSSSFFHRIRSCNPITQLFYYPLILSSPFSLIVRVSPINLCHPSSRSLCPVLSPFLSTSRDRLLSVRWHTHLIAPFSSTQSFLNHAFICFFMIIAYGTVSCFFADDFLPCQTLSTNSPSVLLSDLQYAIMPPVSLCMPPPFSCLALEPSLRLCLGLLPSSFELFFNSIFDIISLTILFHAPCFVFF